MAYIELKNITFTYPTTQYPAVEKVYLEVEKGQFVVLFGSSGSGKSTLLRLLKKDIQPYGILEGEILVDGQNVQETQHSANRIGFVFQDPENQVVADDVLHEVVFGLENIGLPTNEMRNRVAELVHYFGAESLLHRKIHELSGGMKQQINLASVLLMQPDILLLDEPTAQLDPVSAREFLDMLVRLNEEFGMTIILAEHRLDEVFTIADKVIMMEKGKAIEIGSPREVLERIWESPNRPYVPSIPSLFLTTRKKENRLNLPLSVKEGRNSISKLSFQDKLSKSDHTRLVNEKKLIEVKDLNYRYKKEDKDVLLGCHFSLMKGEIYALLGGNGSGKSTLLKLLTGILKPNKGKVILQDRLLKSWKSIDIARIIGYLPQNPKLFFIHDTVEKEIQETLLKWGTSGKEEAQKLIDRLDLEPLLKKHPFDLSGGELQKAALACVLLRKPEILLLDEPTKGLDPISKENFAQIITELSHEGLTILMATHDIEFAASNATKCGMLFQGEISSENTPKEFLKGNFFYTTMIQRLFRHLPAFGVVSLEEAISICKSKVE